MQLRIEITTKGVMSIFKKWINKEAESSILRFLYQIINKNIYYERVKAFQVAVPPLESIVPKYSVVHTPEPE